MAYSVIDPSGCDIYKGRVKLRLSMYLEPNDPHYDKSHVYVPVFPTGGYPGGVDVLGMPTDQVDYDAWVASLPHIWRDNPFHNHFIYPDLGVSADTIKEQIEGCLNYFVGFHRMCWDTGKEFIEMWKKVPVKSGMVRHRFVSGNPLQLQASQLQLGSVLANLKEFEIKIKTIPIIDMPTGEGTIDIGAAATDRTGSWSANYTLFGLANPANATGSLDTVQVWFASSTTTLRSGTFSLVEGTTYECRDSATLGSAASGSMQPFTSLSIDVATDDYLGVYYTDGQIEADGTNNAGLGDAYVSGEYIDPEDQASFTVRTPPTTKKDISLYGSGTEAAAGWSHKFLGVANAAIGKINGVAIASILKVNGVE